MGKYTELQASIFQVFASSEWASEKIVTYPDNYKNNDLDSEFIRLNILASKPNPTKTLQSISGQLIIDIFQPIGGGPTRASQIADKLDKYLANKFLSGNGGNTQLSESMLSYVGIDSANPSLCRYQYTLPFNYFGV